MKQVEDGAGRSMSPSNIDGERTSKEMSKWAGRESTRIKWGGISKRGGREGAADPICFKGQNKPKMVSHVPTPHSAGTFTRVLEHQGTEPFLCILIHGSVLSIATVWQELRKHLPSFKYIRLFQNYIVDNFTIQYIRYPGS